MKKSLKNIEKSWLLNEKKSFYNKTSQSNSAICSKSTSRTISPISISNQSKKTEGLGLQNPLTNEIFENLYENLKEKEENLNILSEIKEYQENHLQNMITDYKKKKKELDDERDEILKIKAKLFAKVKKMKEVENWLNEREKLVKISKKETFEFKNNENSSFYKEKLKLQAAFTKINQEFENLNKEKIEICRLKTFLSQKYETVKILWPEIEELLNAYKETN